jgi:hypothetical protein
VKDLVTLLVASRDAVSLDELKSYELRVCRAGAREDLDWRGLAAAGRIGLGARAGDAVAPSGSTSASANGARPEGIPLPRLLATYGDEPLIGRERDVELLRETTTPKAGRAGRSWCWASRGSGGRAMRPPLLRRPTPKAQFASSTFQSPAPPDGSVEVKSASEPPELRSGGSRPLLARGTSR